MSSLLSNKSQASYSPTGTYFFYGTLRDPRLLAGLLGLRGTPELRPAYLLGYAPKKWGPYPALVKGAQNQHVEGAAFDVPDEEAAAELQRYETNNYAPEACVITVQKEDGTQERVDGFTFVFCGNESNLVDGVFDLDEWLRKN